MWIFTVTLALSLAAVFVLGVVSLWQIRSAQDFLVAGRRYGGFSIGGSLAATILGASATLGLAGLAATRGLTGAWWLLVGPIGLLVLFLFVPRVKRFPVSTLPELIGHWYGPLVRRAAGLLVACAWLGIVGAQMSATGRILSSFWPGGYPLWTAAVGLLFVLYTAAGGQVSVIRTDLLQIGLVLAGVVAAATGGLAAAGGWPGLLSGLEPALLRFPVSPAFGWADLLLLLVTVGTTYLIGPDMLSRLFCSRDVRSARRGILLAVAVIVPAALLITLIGLEARALLPGLVGSPGRGEAAFPELIRRVLPAPLGALTLVALIAAFLSSANTTLLTTTAIVAVDLLGLRADGATSVRRLRAIALLIGLLALGVALSSRGIIPSLLLGYTVFTGGLAVPVVAGLAGRPMSRPAALAAMAGGAAGAGREAARPRPPGGGRLPVRAAPAGRGPGSAPVTRTSLASEPPPSRELTNPG